MVLNENNKINIEIDGTIETLDVLRQGEIFILNRSEGDQLSVVNIGKGSWKLVNGVVDEQSVDNIGKALTDYFGLEKSLNPGTST